jgi:transcriptional regulator with XRE-family HTH domain
MIAEIPLADQRLATIALNDQRKRLGLEVLDLEDKSGVSASAFFAWKSSSQSATFSRSPSFLSMVAVAQTLGFETVLRHESGREHRVMTAKEAMALINVERRARGMTFADCEQESGVCAATYFPIAAGRRDPRTATLVAIAAALGFELVLKVTN